MDVTGPLAEPEFSPVKRTVVTSAARALVWNVSRPAAYALSPVGRFWKGSSREDPCKAQSDGSAVAGDAAASADVEAGR